MQIALPKWIFSLHFHFGRALDLNGQKGHSYASIHGLRTYPWFPDALYTGDHDPGMLNNKKAVCNLIETLSYWTVLKEGSLAIS